jgi:hypothetical protein
LKKLVPEASHGTGAPHLDVAVGKLVVVAAPLVDDLRDADDLAVVVADGHAHQRVSLVARFAVDLPVEPRVLGPGL